MNAIVAPTAELRITLEPTRDYPRLLVVTRLGSYVHASLLVRVRKSLQSMTWLASDDSKRVWIATQFVYGEQWWWLHIGGGAIAVSEKEANRLRDELQLPVRGAP